MEINVENLRFIIDKKANEFGVVSAIHPDDHIFNYVIQHEGMPDEESRINYYFFDGYRSAGHVHELAQQYLPEMHALHLLDFASGYGCVTRHLVKNKNFVTTAIDIHPHAVSFLKSEIGVKSHLSSHYPEGLEATGAYDFTYALSFFSHMPILTWARWLAKLAYTVRPGGILVFTTQGAKSREHFGNPAIPDGGYWFQRSSEQKDLSVDEYGSMIVTEAFVKSHIETMPFLELLDFRPAFWWEVQDAYVVRRKF